MDPTAAPSPRPTRRRLLGGLLLAPLAGAARAEGSYPARTITLVVPFAPGGIADITARTVAQAMAADLGRSIVVDNRPGAGSIVASSAVAQARPDGHTLLLVSNGHAVSASQFARLPFDVERDFVPVTTLGFFDLAVFAAADSRHASLAAMVADARARPGTLTLGTVSAGSTQNLAAQLFKTVAGIDAVVVPYQATPALVVALRNGEIDAAFEILGPMLPQLQAKAVKALAVTSARRYPGLPDVPTVQEAGIGGYEVSSWNGLAAPRGTPEAVVARLNQAARRAVASPAVQARLEPLGVRLQAGTPAQLAQLLSGEIARWREVQRAAGIVPR